MYLADLELPELCERIRRADKVELACIQLLEIGQIPDDALLDGLRKLIQKRFAALKAANDE